MCGIAGMVSSDPRRVPLETGVLQRMVDALEHRGPDEGRIHREPGVALGMRRLSVIDVEGSHQPVRTEDGHVLAMFNGELFGFERLRRDLEARGHRFATCGDGETLVHLYEDHGLAFPRRLRGMFAIALWDRPRRRLVLVRDRMGVKPLYVARGPEGLAFASEVKALIAGGLVRPELDPVAAELFLAHGYVPGPRTLFAGVEKLPPASMLVWEAGRPAGRAAWWSAWEEAEAGPGHGTWEEDQEQLLHLVRTAVHDRMVSDVPLGAMLSGGLDSSLITALMTERSSGPVRTFSIGFAEDAAANELDDARLVARRLGTEHHELVTSAVDHPALLDRVLWHQEEPVADVSGLGFLLLSELARETVTVALSGQGADELLGGYRKHEIAAMASAFRRGVPRPARRVCAAVARRAPSCGPFARGMLAVSTDDPVERLLAMSRVVQARDRDALLDPGFRRPAAEAEAEIAGAVRAHLPPGTHSPLAETLHLDGRLALVDNMLLYFDKLSMATSLEVRVPFMDHDVVGFCTGLPDARRVWRLRRKELLKRASRGLIPDAIIDKPKRGFFHAALGAWLDANRPLVEETLRDGRALARGQLDPVAVDRLLAPAASPGKKHAQQLFSLVLLERWQRMFVDGELPAGATRVPVARAA